MKIHLYYEGEHDKRVKRYDERYFKNMPAHILNLLDSASDFNIGSFSYEGHDHVALCDHLKKMSSSPCSIILFEQRLDDSHFEDPACQDIREVEGDSELDEMIYRIFGDEMNRKQMTFFDSLPKNLSIKEKDELTKKNFQKLRDDYSPEAMQALEEQYKSFYRGFWRKKFDEAKVTLPRKLKEHKRKINLPKPLSALLDLDAEQQLYFVPEGKFFTHGKGAGSYTRYIHSLFGFAFAKYQKEFRKIPTHLLIYDKHNQLKFIDSLDSLCLMSSSLGSNYSFPKAMGGKDNRKELLDGVLLCGRSNIFD